MTGIIEYPNFTKETSQKLLKKHPDRIPVLITKLYNNLEMKKTKYLVPTDLTVGQLQYVFRKSITNINESDSIFILIDRHNLLMPSSYTMQEMYNQYSHDGFIKLHISKENTFG